MVETQGVHGHLTVQAYVVSGRTDLSPQSWPCTGRAHFCAPHVVAPPDHLRPARLWTDLPRLLTLLPRPSLLLR
jgi:hypothetical protein